jgi:hypothetical protein
MDEKRAVLRRRTYMAAQFSSHDGIAWSEGVVRNFSEAGALIEVTGSPLPDALQVAIPVAGLRTQARVAWRDGARAGLQFLRPPAPAALRAPKATPYDDRPDY